MKKLSQQISHLKSYVLSLTSYFIRIASYFFLLTSAIFLLTSSTKAQTLHVFMHNCAFLPVSSDTSYVETYIVVPGFELNYVKNDSGKFEGALEVTLLYLKDTNVYKFDKYVLRTPEIADTSQISFDVLDLRRVSLPDGEYTVHLEVKDANRTSSYADANQGLKVQFDRKNISLSDIEFVQNYSVTTKRNLYSKSGYDIHPMAIPYFPNVQNTLTFYNEIYNAKAVAGDDDILIMYSVKEAHSNNVADELFRFTRQKASTVNVLFSSFDITDLPTGNYVLDVQVKSKKNELLAEQTAFFQRMNKNSVYQLNSIALIDISDKFVKFMPADSMNYYLKCLLPHAELYERTYILHGLQTNDTLLMKQFFYNFWQRRNATDPHGEWSAYKQMVDAVNYNYSTPVSHGFETDRGRVYLQYGPPNRIDGSDREPNAYPYEIWQYYTLTNNQSNVKFVFCNADLATNDYKLIHSDARGELSDPRWKFKIFKTFKDVNGYSNFDTETYPDSFGSQVDELYNR
ncbi:MAG TPA: GWxTD domain-containing protein [Chitinophagales bacterium]|nr:GWxTD domain-containing protein [Chitinophagales bacterium]